MMKKLVIAAAIIFSMSMTSLYAQQGSLFNRGSENLSEINDVDNGSLYFNNSLGGRDGEVTPVLPGSHGLFNNQAAPLGGGVLLLIGMGAAYAVCRKRKED